MSTAKRALLIWNGLGVVVALMLVVLGLDLFAGASGSNPFARGLAITVSAGCWAYIWRKLLDADRRSIQDQGGNHA